MEIEVHQLGGVLGVDRRYLVKDGAIEVIDKGRSRGSKHLDPSQAARIDQLASHAAAAQPVKGPDRMASDGMTTTVGILVDEGDKRFLEVESGDLAAPVWDLIGEVSRASEA
jgi:hypothetical protein